ncbi:Type 1 glutamine amidotransferase-like domain-containing protein [Candidatus Saccharibacteria bacterium]|nr:Type 1 glutamine amidotransferase-like domain-containing protein [Candidatus Saccharibacteria bacterium]
MRLYLASEELGEHADVFRRLVGEGGKVLVISNARDYKTPEERAEIVGRMLFVLRENGFEATELDLRPYFGKPAELKSFIDNAQPAAIFSIGGNCFLLNTAMHLSGMDEIIREGVKNDRFAYGGYSAGSMVASNSLKYFGHGHLSADAVPGIYGTEAVVDCLGLIDEYVTPHADVPKHAETTKMYIEKITAGGDTPVTLNQSSVYVIDGEEKKILP